MFSPQDGEVLPVLIRNSEGELLGTGISNEKGFRKSIERQEAWLLDGNTGRLLPSRRIDGFQEIQHREGYYEIISRGFNSSNEVNPSPASDGSSQSGEAGGASTDAEAAGKNRVSRMNGLPPADSEKSDGNDIGAFLHHLEDTIRQRKKEMPAGSYTTHLFEKGEEKIRKKTGEEAVELLLARDNQELASEAADLIYHLMVLFVQREMKFGDAVDVLRSRHS